MAECVLCSRKITVGVDGNDSKEHIIPNSIGGRKVISGFICQHCNSKSGDACDAELARQLNWWSLTLGIKRQRNPPPPMKVNVVGVGKAKLNYDGSLETLNVKCEKMPISGGGYNLSISAPSIKQAEKMIDGLKKKHPSADLESIKSKLHVVSTPNPIVEVDASFGGTEIGISAIKSVCALASSIGLGAKDFDLGIRFVRGDLSNPPYSFFYNRDLVFNRPLDHLFHCISVQSDTNRKLLLGYVEYFGFGRFVIILSSNYIGGNVSKTYAINPTEGKEIELSVALDISDIELHEIKEGNYNEKGYISALDYALPIALKVNKRILLDNACFDIYKKVLEEFDVSPGQVVSEELARKMSIQIAEYVQPLLSKYLSSIR